MTKNTLQIISELKSLEEDMVGMLSLRKHHEQVDVLNCLEQFIERILRESNYDFESTEEPYNNEI